MPEAGFGLHLGGGVVHFPPAVLEREGIGDPAGFALGFHLLAWRFLFADAGIGWLWATDRRPFLETACDTQGRGCADDESMIDGYMGWFKAGPQARFFVPVGADALELAVLGGFGVKDWNLSREAKHGGATCIDCRSDDLDADGGVLLSPEIDIAYAFGTQADSAGFGVKAVYEHYLSGEALRGLWLSAFFEAYVW